MYPSSLTVNGIRYRLPAKYFKQTTATLWDFIKFFSFVLRQMTTWFDKLPIIVFIYECILRALNWFFGEIFMYSDLCRDWIFHYEMSKKKNVRYKVHKSGIKDGWLLAKKCNDWWCNAKMNTYLLFETLFAILGNKET